MLDVEVTTLNDGRYVRLFNTPTPDDARRIVACVNACAGLSTEGLEASARFTSPNERLMKLYETIDAVLSGK